MELRGTVKGTGTSIALTTQVFQFEVPDFQSGVRLGNLNVLVELTDSTGLNVTNIRLNNAQIILGHVDGFVGFSSDKLIFQYASVRESSTGSAYAMTEMFRNIKPLVTDNVSCDGITAIIQFDRNIGTDIVMMSARIVYSKLTGKNKERARTIV